MMQSMSNQGSVNQLNIAPNPFASSQMASLLGAMNAPPLMTQRTQMGNGEQPGVPGSEQQFVAQLSQRNSVMLTSMNVALNLANIAPDEQIASSPP